MTMAWCSRIGMLAAGMLAFGAAALAQAQQAAPVPLTQGDDAVALPGVGRIVLVFLLVAGLAVAIAAVLRRVLPKFNSLPATGGNLRILNRMNLGAGLRVYAVQYEDQTVLLAEGRHGLALTVLKKTQEPS